MPEQQPPEPLVVVTPWYPTEDQPYHGIFVREAVRSLGRGPQDVVVIHLDTVPPGRDRQLERTLSEEARVVRVPVTVPPGTSRTRTAQLHAAALAGAALPELLAAPVVHAHVGMPAGWAAAQVVPSGTRLVVTEHATYLPTILRTPVGARYYGELLARADALLTVGEKEARELRRQFPAAAAIIRSAGNPVREERFRLRRALQGDLDRWLYVGNLVPRKGVDRLVRALAARVRAEPGRDTRLRLVGDGPQRAELERLARELGVSDRVAFHGPAAPDDLPALFERSDVLLHLSDYETFGLTVVEAAMSGLPVVVTACGGPTETLADAAAAGLVRFVPVRPQPDVVVAAVADLERSARRVDVAAVREVLVERYGARAFGARLAAVLSGGETTPVGAGVTVLGLATSPAGAATLSRLVQELLRRGGRPVVVTDQRGEAAASDRRATVVDLYRYHRWMPLHLLEDVLLGALPSAALRAARAAVGALTGVPGPLRAPASRGVNALSGLVARHGRVAEGVHAKILHPYLYARVDPPRAARQVERHHLDQLAALAPSVLLVPDATAEPLAQVLVRAMPDLLVLRAPTEAAVRALPSP